MTGGSAADEMTGSNDGIGCDHCNAHDCCEGAVCGDGHCASCGMPLPASLNQVAYLLLKSFPVARADRFTGNPGTPFFRPPRA